VGASMASQGEGVVHIRASGRPGLKRPGGSVRTRMGVGRCKRVAYGGRASGCGCVLQKKSTRRRMDELWCRLAWQVRGIRWGWEVGVGESLTEYVYQKSKSNSRSRNTSRRESRSSRRRRSSEGGKEQR
jgi:hypothetical protein